MTPAAAPSPSDEAEALAVLAVARTAGVGPRRAAELLRHFGTAALAVDGGLRGSWPSLRGWDAATSRSAGRGVDLAAAGVERARGARVGARLVTVGSPTYPASWRPDDGWPPALWVRGAWPEALLGDRPAGVAVVGPRKASRDACDFAREVATAAAWAGAWVVSGLAYGVDAAAHEGAVSAARAGAPAATIAVLAGGVDRVHPSGHRDLARALLDAGGGLVAAGPIGSVPAVGAFPVRNRWIAGLAGVVAVIEAGERSGALHTAAAAAELGREVRVAPARPWDQHAAGSLALLRDGAAPLIEADDGWRALPAGTLTTEPRPALGRRAAGQAAAPSPWDLLLTGPPRTADAWAQAAGVPIAATLAALEIGVLEGWAERRADGRYAAAGERRQAPRPRRERGPMP